MFWGKISWSSEWEDDNFIWVELLYLRSINFHLISYTRRHLLSVLGEGNFLLILREYLYKLLCEWSKWAWKAVIFFCSSVHVVETVPELRLQQWLQLFLHYAKVNYYPVVLQVGFLCKMISQTCCSSVMCFKEMHAYLVKED